MSLSPPRACFYARRGTAALGEQKCDRTSTATCDAEGALERTRLLLNASPICGADSD